MRLPVLTVCLAFTACSSALPCTSCPPVDGTYAVSWVDGGNEGCPGPRVPTWKLTEKAPQVTTTLNDIPLGGTLYDSYDLLLTGGEVGLTYRLRALVIPEGTSTDAGVRLQGTLTSRVTPSGGEACESVETFTAQRTSR